MNRKARTQFHALFLSFAPSLAFSCLAIWTFIKICNKSKITKTMQKLSMNMCVRACSNCISKMREYTTSERWYISFRTKPQSTSILLLWGDTHTQNSFFFIGVHGAHSSFTINIHRICRIKAATKFSEIKLSTKSGECCTASEEKKPTITCIMDERVQCIFNRKILKQKKNLGYVYLNALRENKHKSHNIILRCYFVEAILSISFVLLKIRRKTNFTIYWNCTWWMWNGSEHQISKYLGHTRKIDKHTHRYWVKETKTETEKEQVFIITKSYWNQIKSTALFYYSCYYFWRQILWTVQKCIVIATIKVGPIKNSYTILNHIFEGITICAVSAAIQ